MVKGVTRQVIVVKSPDPKLFEQAIFIMREDAFVEGVSADQVIQEAQQVAKSYVKQNSRWGRLSRAIPAGLHGGGGSGGHRPVESGHASVKNEPPGAPGGSFSFLTAL